MKKVWLAISLLLVCCFGVALWIGIPKLFVNLYAPDGKVKSVLWFDMENYISGGWYEEPVVTMYAIDGEKTVVYAAETEEYRADGWYEEPVSILYSKEGEPEIVPTSLTNEKLKNGYLTEPVAHMMKDEETEEVFSSQVDVWRNDGWMIENYCVGLSRLRQQIEEYMQSMQGDCGIYIKNLSTGDLLVLNDRKYPAASVIKLYQMATIYDEIHKGNLKMNYDIEFYLHEMITVSDNYASNELVRIVGHGDYREGFDVLNRFVQSVGCVNTQQLSLFSGCGHFVAYGNNDVSPYDCGMTLEQIYRGTLVSQEYSEEMLSLLKQQTRQHKIPYDLPEGVICANKTGETSTIENDVAIVYSPNCDYIICVMTNNNPIGVYDIHEISKMTYQYFNP